MELQGITGLYAHQLDGLEALRAGRDVIMATGTASGKTLVYHLAFAAAVLERPTATALCLYPTKALARDQLRAVRALKLSEVKGARVRRRHAEGRAAADPPQREPRDDEPRHAAPGDPRRPSAMGRLPVPPRARGRRRGPRVPGRLRLARGDGAAPAATADRALRRGPAVGARERHRREPRRARRAAHGSRARGDHGRRLPAGARSGSPCGTRRSWTRRRANDGARSARRRGCWPAWSTETSARSGSHGRGGPPSCSPSSHGRASATLRRRDRIKAYRAGYLADERRRVERALADGELLAVASTNALELGVDIGSLDAAILTGYPGTRASMWQQAGRAGRRDTGSLAVLVAQDDPLDQFLVQHPEDLFDKPPEAAVIDPDEPVRAGTAPAMRGARTAAPRRRGRGVLRSAGRRCGRADDRREAS